LNHIYKVSVTMLVACTFVGWDSRLREQAYRRIFLLKVDENTDYSSNFDEEAEDPMAKMWVAVLQGDGGGGLQGDEGGGGDDKGGGGGKGSGEGGGGTGGRKKNTLPTLGRVESRRPSQLDRSALAATPAFMQLNSLFDGLGDYTSLDFNMVELENRTHCR
jgi:hypothetical protein